MSVNLTNKMQVTGRDVRPMDREPVYLGVPQIAAALGFSEPQCRRWIKNGTLRTKRLGNLHVATESSLQEFIKSLGEMADEE